MSITRCNVKLVKKTGRKMSYGNKISFSKITWPSLIRTKPQRSKLQSGEEIVWNFPSENNDCTWTWSSLENFLWGRGKAQPRGWIAFLSSLRLQSRLEQKAKQRISRNYQLDIRMPHEITSGTFLLSYPSLLFPTSIREWKRFFSRNY